jgi:hypothetical protein
MCVSSPIAPPKIATDTQSMLDKSKSYETSSKIDLTPFAKYTGKIGDYLIFRDLTKMMEAKAIRHIDDMTFSTVLLNMDPFAMNHI